jgi:hypothetical protein
MVYGQHGGFPGIRWRMGKRPTGEAEETPVRRTYSTLPLAQLVPAVTRSSFRKRSPAGAELMADWANVVGGRLALATEPRRLSRGQLTIACAGPMAMELQHVAAELIERINTYAGSKLVGRLRFVQDHVAVPPATVPRQRTVAPQPVADLPPGELNDALAALLAAIRSTVA